MEHKGWDLEDDRWIRLDYLWLISAELLIRVRPLEQMPPIKWSPKYSRSVLVDELRVGLLSSGSLRMLMLTDGEWEATVYSGTYWYGLYTEPPAPPDEESDQTS